jgi:hypothetical protein
MNNEAVCPPIKDRQSKISRANHEGRTVVVVRKKYFGLGCRNQPLPYILLILIDHIITTYLLESCSTLH